MELGLRAFGKELADVVNRTSPPTGIMLSAMRGSTARHICNCRAGFTTEAFAAPIYLVQAPGDNSITIIKNGEANLGDLYGLDRLLLEASANATSTANSTISEGRSSTSGGLEATDGRLEVAIDVGANIGFFTIALSRLLPRAVVVALEPSPTTFFYLRWNLWLNRVPLLHHWPRDHEYHASAAEEDKSSIIIPKVRGGGRSDHGGGESSGSDSGGGGSDGGGSGDSGGGGGEIGGDESGGGDNSRGGSGGGVLAFNRLASRSNASYTFYYHPTLRSQFSYAVDDDAPDSAARHDELRSRHDMNVTWHTQRMQSIDLLTLLRERRVSSIRFLKFDCEGSEYSLLSAWNASGWLSDTRRVQLLGGELHQYHSVSSARQGENATHRHEVDATHRYEVRTVIHALISRGCRIVKSTTIAKC